MIAPHARERVGKRQFVDERIHHEQRLQQTLRVLMPPHDLAPLLLLQEAFERLLFTLQTVDGLRLLAVFVDREHQAAVQQLFVESMAVVVRNIITGPSTRY